MDHITSTSSTCRALSVEAVDFAAVSNEFRMFLRVLIGTAIREKSQATGNELPPLF